MTKRRDLVTEQLRHQLRLQRYSSSVVREIITLLNASDAHLTDMIRGRLTDDFTRNRLEELLAEVRALNIEAYAAIGARMSGHLQDTAAYEVEFQHGLLSSYLPIGVSFTFPPPGLVTQLALTDPLRGKLMTEWVGELGAARYGRIRDALRIGLVEGQTVEQMVAAIRGTRASGYSDGLLEIDRRNAQTFVRTAVNDVTTRAQQTLYDANGDIVKSVQWVATLDERTCPTCAPLDGQTFKLAEGPRPPRHHNCRCRIVPVLDARFALLEGIGSRASQHGPVPSTQTYGAWLKSQDAAFQDEVLGPARGALLRRGGLDVSRFVDRAGNELTLAELRDREPSAFNRANL